MAHVWEQKGMSDKRGGQEGESLCAANAGNGLRGGVWNGCGLWYSLDAYGWHAFIVGMGYHYKACL